MLGLDGAFFRVSPVFLSIILRFTPYFDLKFSRVTLFFCPISSHI